MPDYHRSEVESLANVAAVPSSRRRDWLLIVGLLVVAVAAFFVALWLATQFHHRQAALGKMWFNRGQQQMSAGQPQVALQSFVNALSYERNPEYRLRLAESLIAIGELDEAREHLLSLWQAEPGDGNINLELARLAARAGKTAQARRYYQAAYYGAWPRNADQIRRDIRIELVQYLLSQHDTSAATASLIDLASSIPPDAKLATEVGQLFLEAGDPGRARSEFDDALKAQHGYVPALRGAVQAAFALENYAAVLRYARELSANNQLMEPERTTAETASLVMRLDPDRPGIGAAERRSRARRDAEVVSAAADACAAQPANAGNPQLQAVRQKLAAARDSASDRDLRRDPDLLDTLLQTVFDAESVVNERCGTRTPEQKALTIIAQKRRTGPQS